jgi:hypothetical protein
MNDTLVFSKTWFKQHQKPLLWFANTIIGRYVLRIHGKRSDVGKRKIIRIDPNAIFWIKEMTPEGPVFQVEFRTHDKYAKRLYYAFKPIWWLFHAWDSFTVACPQLNLGFDTLTKYPGSIGVDNPCDGYIQLDATNQTYANIIATTTASSTTNVVLGVTIQCHLSNTNYFKQLTRSILCFDTSALTSGATISAAVISLKGNTKTSQLTNKPSYSIVSSSPASTSALATTDIDNVGNTSFAAVAYDSVSTSGYSDWTLDASGRANISKTGISKFGIRDSWDLAGTFGGVWTSNSVCQIYWDSAATSGTSTDPKLVVTYTTGITQLCSETITFPDTVLKSTSTVKSETVSLVAVVLKGPGKLLEEAIALVDIILRSVTRIISDPVVIVDTFTSLLTKLKEFLESIVIVAVVNKGMTRILDSAIAVADYIERIPGKILNETLSLIEDLLALRSRIAELIESIAITDVVTKSIEKVFAFAVTVSDVITKSFYRMFTEAIGLCDLLISKMPWMKQGRPSTSYTKQDGPETSFTRSTRPTTVYTKQDRP